MNGWIRLWIVGSVLGLIFTIPVIYGEWPKVADIPHSDDLYGDYQPLKDYEKGVFDHYTDPDIQWVQMANGHKVPFHKWKRSVSPSSVKHLYLKSLKRETYKLGGLLVLKYFIIWLGISMSILFLGFCFSWVKSGFSSNR